MSVMGSGSNVFGLLFQRAPNRVFLVILLDALSGLLAASIIPLILGSISNLEDARPSASAIPQFETVESATMTFLSFEVANYQYAILFLSVVGLILLTKGTSRILMERVASSVTAELRVRLYQWLLQAPVVAVERVGPVRVMAILAEDVSRIIQAGRLFPVMLSILATLMGILGYLAFLNPRVLWFVVQALVFGILTHQIPLQIGLRFAGRRREYVDRLHRSVRALLDGFKELKLDRRKRESFLKDYLFVNEMGVRDADRTGYAIMTVGGIYGEMLGFVAIGIVTFVFINYNAISGQELFAVVMTLMYITTPIAAILNAAPDYVTAHVSLKQVNRLFDDLPVETAKPNFDAPAPWQRICFENVVFRHHASQDRKAYAVGPVSLDIVKGEITIIAGGNGSGKSTLAKLMTLHYCAESGEIRFGDELITDDTLNRYRQQIAFIYSDYYLFESLLGFEERAVKTEVDRWLHALELDDKVTFENGRFSTLCLSDGQCRRLALLVAFLEDKELYLFDEWAADQDPIFKEVFYYELLPDLKRRGKAVVVISHDERYFETADRLLIMEDGKLVHRQDAMLLKKVSTRR
jgi:putative ATP-binding cassette transporter